MEVMTRIKVTPCTVVNRYPTISVPPTLIENSVWVTSSPSSLSAVIWTTLRPSFASAPKHAFGMKKKNNLREQVENTNSRLLVSIQIRSLNPPRPVHWTGALCSSWRASRLTTPRGHTRGGEQDTVITNSERWYPQVRITYPKNCPQTGNQVQKSLPFQKVFQQHNR